MPADDDEPELSYSKYNLKLDQTKISQIKISSKIVAIGTSSGKESSLKLSILGLIQYNLNGS